MKRRILIGSLAVAAIIVGWLAGVISRVGRMEAQETRPAVYAQPTAAAKPTPVKWSKLTKEQTTAELVAIIQETESQETFLLSLMSLVALDPHDPSILPLAIRKAEKLDLLKGMLNDQQLRPGQESLMQMFMVMLGDKLEPFMHAENRFSSPPPGSGNPSMPRPCCGPQGPCVLETVVSPAPPTMLTPVPAAGADFGGVVDRPQPQTPALPVQPAGARRMMPPPQPISPSSN